MLGPGTGPDPNIAAEAAKAVRGLIWFEGVEYRIVADSQGVFGVVDVPGSLVGSYGFSVQE